jgi:peroxiredoxin Q/BCP
MARTMGSNWLSFLQKPASRPALALGDGVPAVTAIDEHGRPRPLVPELSEGWVLVYFYPRANTPGCTLQACSLRDGFEELTELGVRVYGVSTDSAPRQKRFQERRRLPFTLFSDPEKKVLDAFGVPTIFGVASRTAFLFKEGRLVWRDLSASTRKQAADVIAIVRAERSDGGVRA